MVDIYMCLQQGLEQPENIPTTLPQKWQTSVKSQPSNLLFLYVSVPVSETRILSVRQGYIVRYEMEQRNGCDTFEDHERKEETI